MLALLLSLFFSAKDLADLNDPRFKVREAASAHIRKDLNLASVRILKRLSMPSLEAQTRVNRLISGFEADRAYRIIRHLPESWDDLPTMDMYYPLKGNETDWRFYALSWNQESHKWMQLTDGNARLACKRAFSQLRYATWLMMKDLYLNGVPKFLIERQLHIMWQREKEWDKTHGRPNESYPPLAN